MNWKRLLPCGLAMLLLVGCSADQSTPPRANEPPPSASPSGARIKFLEFHADWCGPCRQQKPIVEEMKKRFPTIEFEIVDVDEKPEMAQKYQVTAIPRMVVLLDGKIIEDLLGFQERGRLEEVLERALARAGDAKAEPTRD